MAINLFDVLNGKTDNTGLKIPGTIAPDKYPGNEQAFEGQYMTFTPLIIPGLGVGKYMLLEDNEDPYNAVIFPRSGCTYDLTKGIKAHRDSGNVTLYKDGHKWRVNMYELQEMNERLLIQRERKIKEQAREYRRNNRENK